MLITSGLSCVLRAADAVERACAVERAVDASARACFFWPGMGSAGCGSS